MEAEESEEAIEADTTNNNTNQMSSRGGEASGAAASGRRRDSAARLREVRGFGVRGVRPRQRAGVSRRAKRGGGWASFARGSSNCTRTTPITPDAGLQQDRPNFNFFIEDPGRWECKWNVQVLTAFTKASAQKQRRAPPS